MTDDEVRDLCKHNQRLFRDNIALKNEVARLNRANIEAWCAIIVVAAVGVIGVLIEAYVK